MSDRLFYINSGPYKLSAIAEHIGCEIPSDTTNNDFYNIKSLSEASGSDISFLSNKKYTKDFKISNAGACIVPLDFAENSASGTILLKVKNPYYSYARLVDFFYASGKKYSPQIKPSAHIAASAKIGKNCYIGHNVVIEDEVEIGDNSVIESGAFIDYRVKIGQRAMIYSNVSISYSEIGDDAVILPGAKIGQDGFGFATERGIHKKIYHTGRVIVGNNVEIGANTTIDRGSMSDTVIEDLCRIDNLVQIGHNVHIKKGAILVGQVGIAGSSTIGSYSALGGQVGIAGHITIADGVQIAGQGGVIQDIKEAGVMGGSPAVPIKDWHRQTIIMKKLIKKEKMTKEIIDINRIMAIIPHRYPFLLLDRVTEVKLNEMAVGIKNVTINEHHFIGHFPSRPVMPGVLIVEALAQLSAVLVAKSMESTRDKEVFFMSIEQAKFRKVVEPGDTLVMTSNIIQNRGTVWKFSAKAMVGDQVAAEASFTAMVKDKDKNDT